MCIRDRFWSDVKPTKTIYHVMNLVIHYYSENEHILNNTNGLFKWSLFHLKHAEIYSNVQRQRIKISLKNWHHFINNTNLLKPSLEFENFSSNFTHMYNQWKVANTNGNTIPHSQLLAYLMTQTAMEPLWQIAQSHLGLDELWVLHHLQNSTAVRTLIL